MLEEEEVTVKDIIDKYYLTNHDILKHALIAKAEEDKRKTAKEVLKIEYARIHLKRLDIQLIQEKSPAPIYPQSAHPLTTPSFKRKRNHQQVMEALKEKIIHNHHHDIKRKCTLPKIITDYKDHLMTPNSTTKPTLPPIDTTFGEILHPLTPMKSPI